MVEREPSKLLTGVRFPPPALPALALQSLLVVLMVLTAAGMGRRPVPSPPPMAPLSSPTADDRLLIVVPHEDDEAIAMGGIIQAALRAGASLRIVYLTYGDHNEWSFLVYKKHLLLSPGFNRRMGQERRREAIDAMQSLGVDQKQLTFLGYPDAETLKIWREHWGAAPPLRSLLTNAAAVPYANADALPSPHKGEAILEDLKRLLHETRPTKIFVTHPADSNPDHQSAYLFVRVALLDLAGVIPPPIVYAAPIHHGRWPSPKGFFPDEPLMPPVRLAEAPIQWVTYHLPPEDVLRKDAAIQRYKSQMAYSGSWLRSFARPNELFGDYPLVDLRAGQRTGDPWAETFLPTPETTTYEELTVGASAVITYRAAEDGLELRIRFRDRLDESFGITVYLFGYRTDVPFAQMPKLQVRLHGGRCTLFDQQRTIDFRGVRWHHEGRELVMHVPLRLLQEPEVLFVQASAHSRDVAVRQTAWRLLAIRNPTPTVAPQTAP